MKGYIAGLSGALAPLRGPKFLHRLATILIGLGWTA
jgi:hypothetical protein